MLMSIPRSAAIVMISRRYCSGIVPHMPRARLEGLFQPVIVDLWTPSIRASSLRLPFANVSMTYCKGLFTIFLDTVCYLLI